MARRSRVLFLLAAFGTLALPMVATADHGNADDASRNMFHVDNLPPAQVHQNCDRDDTAVGQCFNSDLAFYEGRRLRGGFKHILAQGNYEGFRLVDIRDPENPVEISAVECRTNQGDVSFYEARRRLLLIQSIEEQVSSPDCSAAREQPIVTGTNPVTNVVSTFRQKGHEGLRIFDVTDPRAPTHIATVRTACGSHTHTTIADEENDRAIVYVSSYPNSNRVTRKEDLATLPEQPNCIPDHNKISIVEIPDRNPEAARVLKEQPLDQDTLQYNGLGNGGSPVRGCHDITVFAVHGGGDDDGDDGREDEGRNDDDDDGGREDEGRNDDDDEDGPTMVAAGACLSEGQLWDVSDPANPTTNVPGRHTHIRNPFITTSPAPPFTGLFHTASFTWDGKAVVFTDEWQGGGAHGCDGPQDTRGNVWFYDNVRPGEEAPLRGRFILPRPQPANEACTMHNGNVVTTNKAYIGVSSAYQAGTSVFDFSDVFDFPAITGPPSTPPPTAATEVAYFDAKNDPAGPVGIDDAWSTYWHNDYVYASSGLQAPPPAPPATCCVRPGNRGLDVYKILLERGERTPHAGSTPPPNGRQFKAKDIEGVDNPQTQVVSDDDD
jgi:hypothetical protein